MQDLMPGLRDELTILFNRSQNIAGVYTTLALNVHFPSSAFP